MHTQKVEAFVDSKTRSATLLLLRGYKNSSSASSRNDRSPLLCAARHCLSPAGCTALHVACENVPFYSSSVSAARKYTFFQSCCGGFEKKRGEEKKTYTTSRINRFIRQLVVHAFLWTTRVDKASLCELKKNFCIYE